MDDELSFWREQCKYDPEKAQANRKKFLCNTLDTTKKMELYNCSLNGDLEKFKNLIEQKKYPIMEECSASGYYWTSMHYAAHYGFDKIIEYIHEYYRNHPERKSILNLQCSHGRTPLAIYITSSASLDKKKKILELFAMNDVIDFTICSDKDEDIFEICKKQGIAEFLLSVMRED